MGKALGLACGRDAAEEVRRWYLIGGGAAESREEREAEDWWDGLRRVGDEVAQKVKKL